jgi:hypothetical protein
MRLARLLLLCASVAFAQSCASVLFAQSLEGVIDVHAHVDPETIPRSIDAITLAQLAKQEGMRAVVFKNHFFPTTGIAFLVHRAVPGIDVFSPEGVVLMSLHAHGSLWIPRLSKHFLAVDAQK